MLTVEEVIKFLLDDKIVWGNRELCKITGHGSDHITKGEFGIYNVSLSFNVKSDKVSIRSIDIRDDMNNIMFFTNSWIEDTFGLKKKIDQSIEYAKARFVTLVRMSK